MKDIGVSFFGLIASLVVVFILVYMEMYWDFAFYSIMHFYIFPTGAIISGLFAAGGYYLGSIILNVRPGRTILFNMVFISITAYFTLHYLTYRLLDVDGSALSNFLSFTEYMKTSFTNMSMSFGRADNATTELGQFGYLVALIQIAGFAGGAIASHFILSGKTFCQRCDRYYKLESFETRYYDEDTSEKMLETIQRIADELGKAEIGKAIELHNQNGTVKESRNSFLRTEIKLEACPDCSGKFISLETTQFDDADWELIENLSFSGLYEGSVFVRNLIRGTQN